MNCLLDGSISSFFLFSPLAESESLIPSEDKSQSDTLKLGTMASDFDTKINVQNSFKLFVFIVDTSLIFSDTICKQEIFFY